jgi:hypothetical protein
MFSLAKAHRALKHSVVMNQFTRPPGKLPRLVPCIIQHRNTSGVSFDDVKATPNLDSEGSIQEPAQDGSIQREEFWRRIPIWEGVDAKNFMSYRWTVSFDIWSYPHMC